MTAGKLREIEMKKILLMLIIFYSSITISYAEKLPEDIDKFDFGGPETYVPYRQYFAEYTDRLSQAFEPKGKFPWRAYNGTTVKFLAHRDGSISNFEIEWSSKNDYLEFTSKFNPIQRYLVKKAGPKMDEYATEIIKNNPPKPFLDGMDYDDIIIRVEFVYYPKLKNIYYVINGADVYNASTKKYYPPEFTIYLIHDSRKIFK